MTVIDPNEIYKIIYYKYILSLKLLDIIGIKHSQSFNVTCLKHDRDMISDALVKFQFHVTITMISR